jgi:hypothetical protein
MDEGRKIHLSDSSIQKGKTWFECCGRHQEQTKGPIAVIRAVLIIHSPCSHETKNQFLREREIYIGTVLKIIGKLVLICTRSILNQN